MAAATTIRASDERLIRRVAAGIMVTAALVSAPFLAVGNPGFGGGVLAGGLISWLNLRWVAAMVRKLLTGSSGRNFGIKLALKELGLFLGLGVIIALRLLDPVGLVIGLSGLVAGVIVAAALREKGSNPDEPGMDSRSKE